MRTGGNLLPVLTAPAVVSDMSEEAPEVTRQKRKDGACGDRAKKAPPRLFRSGTPTRACEHVRGDVSSCRVVEGWTVGDRMVVADGETSPTA